MKIFFLCNFIFSQLNKRIQIIYMAVSCEMEMSRHIWYAIKEGAGFSATVKSVSPKRSPLKQGRLEIIIAMKAKWQNSRSMDILKRHVEKVSFPEYGEYPDDSSEILKEIMENPEDDSEEESESESEGGDDVE